MSEFECSRGHLMRPSDGPICLECGARVARMDGKSNRELAEDEECMEKRYNEQSNKDCGTREDWEPDSEEDELMPWDDFRGEEADE